MQLDGVDTSSVCFDDLPYAPDDVYGKKKRKKRSAEGDEHKKKKSKKVKKDKEDMKARSLVYSLFRNLLAEVFLNNLLLIFLFPLILILFTLLLPKPLYKHNHLFLTIPHKYQLPFHLHPF